jgi:glycerol-3-phosphate acyltransferase PlsX
MGGDLGPRPAVEGALQAIRRYPDVEVTLVGRERYLRRLLAALKADEPRLRIVDAPDIITMLDNPSESLRKRKSSLAIATALVQEGEADALVSPGTLARSLPTACSRGEPFPPSRNPQSRRFCPVHTGAL